MCTLVTQGAFLRMKRRNPWAEGELSSHAGSAGLSLLLPVPEVHEEGAGLDWTTAPPDTATSVNDLFQAISPSFCLSAGSFWLDQVLSLTKGHV